MTTLLEIQPWLERLGQLGFIVFIFSFFALSKLGKLRTDGGAWQSQFFMGGEYSVPVEKRKRRLQRLIGACAAMMLLSMIGSEGIYVILVTSGYPAPSAPWGLQPLSLFSTSAAIFLFAGLYLSLLVREKERKRPLTKPASYIPPAAELTTRGRGYRWGIVISFGISSGLFVSGIALQYFS